MSNHQIPVRTINHWCKLWREASVTLGYGLLGLLPAHSKKGNRLSKIPEATEKLMYKIFDKYYLTPKAPTKRSAHILYKKFAKRVRIVPCSYESFTKRVRNIQPKHKTLEDKHGFRAAYDSTPFVYTLEYRMPVHGDRVFEVGHIDHTELSIQLRSDRTHEVLGKPWLSFLTDGHTREPLASFLSFEKPSYRTNLALIQDCVRRHNRLPQIIVTDHGSDFESVFYETLLALFGIIKKSRAKGRPRFGSTIERLFGATEKQFVHNLLGNTQNSRRDRKMSASHDPKNFAIWPFRDFLSQLNWWLFEVFPEIEHLGIGCTPNFLFEKSIKQSGLRKFKYIPYDNAFILSTLPLAERSPLRIHSTQGVHCNYLDYYNSIFVDPRLEGERTAVRYNPFDLSYVYAEVFGKWVKCRCTNTLLAGLTERELKDVATMVRQEYAHSRQNYRVKTEHLETFLLQLIQQEHNLLERSKMALQNEVFVDSPQDSDFDEVESQSLPAINLDDLSILSSKQISTGGLVS